MRVSRRFLAVLGAAALVAATVGAFAAPGGAEQAGDTSANVSGVDSSVGTSATGKVLILDTSVSGGTSSLEAQAAVALGFTVDVVTAGTWAGLTPADFASYRAIVIGDATCSSNTSWAAASASTATWGPVVNGNVISIGTDPAYHSGGHPGAITLINKSMAFATAQPGKTGFYADLSCWAPAAGTPVDILNAVEPGFTAGPAGCGDTVAIVATNPYLSGITNTDLQGWSCSVHEYFDTWPADFVPIVLDTTASPLYTAPDGTTGAPYVIGRGAGLVAGDISLSPDSGSSDVSQPYTLTAFVQFQGTIQVGTTVTLKCTGGPNAGLSTTAVTDSNGNATFTLTAATLGTDTCSASFVNPTGIPETSNDATVVWTGAIEIAPRFTG